MNEEIKSKEYLMLRDEVQTNLKLQQTWATLSITSVLTFIGVAYQTETPIFYLIPIIVLLLSAVKVRNYRIGITKIVAYMIVRCECPEGFYWETCLKKYRYHQKIKEQTNKFTLFYDKLFSFMETQEMFLMGVICLTLYIISAWNITGCETVNIPAFITLVEITCFILAIIFISSMDYWNLNPTDIDKIQDTWKEIFIELDKKENNQ